MSIADTVLIANDVPPNAFQKMRSAYLYLSVDSAKEGERVPKLLAEGGEIFMPLEKTFYASRFSMLCDRFGVSRSHTLIFRLPQPSETAVGRAWDVRADDLRYSARLSKPEVHIQ